MIQSLFQRFFGHEPQDLRPGEVDPKGGKARSVAKQRLQFLLVHDRTLLTAPQMEAMRQEIFAVLSRYVEIDPQEIAIDFQPVPDSRKMALVSNIPVKRVLLNDDTH